MPGTEERLLKGMTTGYIGFDPTADSLHIGNLVPITLLMHFQRSGHKPIALVGGATGMVGDPSGKSEERNLLDEETLRHNESCIRKQLEKFLDFDRGDNSAVIVNNYDWFRDMRFLDFIRDVGKHITINYMMAKDSVKNRLETGMSFTEFSYQLVQGYDFYHLYKEYDCVLQMGGSDQWGNIVTGSELIRRLCSGESYALTNPLITKSDGSKFGKTEQGNVWLDPERTSPYQFYQFWLNSSDEDAGRFMRIFTLKENEEITALETQHSNDPGSRILQKELAKDMTIRVHSEKDYNNSVEASQILFGKSTAEQLKSLDEKLLLSVMEGVPQVKVGRSDIESGRSIIEFVSDITGIFPSRGEARKMIQGGGVSLNKDKMTDQNREVSAEDLLNNRYLLFQKGKKNYYLVVVD
jgi:tyrosyl-tRNA synthetase